ncbi:hypothetical protein NHP190012_05630 [Helicobacter sp. NHP19-012]|uniref:Lipoprotein n=1 Tax=Helicobacter gastrofelis TaxID=2849642 RepID=A0ABM7SL91_9HELI|nr:hypothetical protein [Helicobacter sp. NHP19-012]BCZ18921.1 hypothetical protein NHP190012_05630 [Helicobacter sp. NHP19-012]
MSKRAILAGVLCGGVFLGCSVYQSSDPDTTPPPYKKEKPNKQAKAQAKENHALEQQIEQLKNAVATNERKMDALDHKFKNPQNQSPSPNHTPSPQPIYSHNLNHPQVQTHTPPPPPAFKTKSTTIHISRHFLIGYGVSDVSAKTPEDARDSAYFNARRQLTFALYNRLSQALSAYHLRSEHLRNVLLFTIDKAIDSPQIYKEKTLVPLAHYDKTLMVLLVDSAVIEQIRQLVHTQYHFSTQHRHLFDHLLYGVQIELLH